MAEEWHNFQNFAKWFEENYNLETMEGWYLDKDILIKGNKIYSSETCCFVPQEINSIFTDRKSCRGELPIGVRLMNRCKKFYAIISVYGKQKIIGSYNTPEEAFEAYKTEKEKYIKEVADKWRKLIDTRVYQALYNHQVEITD